VAAVQYFRGLVQGKIQGRKDSLSDVLGSRFQPRYSNLLNLIPPLQITHVDPKPLGEDDRGLVYKAIWSHQHGIADISLVHDEVVLKSIKVDGSETTKFLKEVCTHASRNSNKVQFIDMKRSLIGHLPP
jgi:hypothetical protein